MFRNLHSEGSVSWEELEGGHQETCACVEPAEAPVRGPAVTRAMFWSFSTLRVPRDAQRLEVIFFLEADYHGDSLD